MYSILDYKIPAKMTRNRMIDKANVQSLYSEKDGFP